MSGEQYTEDASSGGNIESGWWGIVVNAPVIVRVCLLQMHLCFERNSIIFH